MLKNVLTSFNFNEDLDKLHRRTHLKAWEIIASAMDGLVAVLRDPMVPTIVAVFLFVVGQWWWRRKDLIYMSSAVRVLSVREEVRARVQILFDGCPASDVWLVVIRVNNSGSQPICASDFERPLRFQWKGPRTQILTAEVGKVRTKRNLQPAIKKDGNELLLEPLLLNGGDWFEINVLVNEGVAFSVDGRIVGVKQIRQMDAGSLAEGKRWRNRSFVILFLLLFTWMGESLGVWAKNGAFERLLLPVLVLTLLLFLLTDLGRNLEKLYNWLAQQWKRP